MSDRPLDLEFLRALPKVDLHRHLEGSLRLETLWEFHRRNRQRLYAGRAELQAACTIPRGARPGFQNFLRRFLSLRFKFGGSAALEHLAAEAVADAAADGVVHLELRFSPTFFALRMRPASSARRAVSCAPELSPRWGVTTAEAEEAAAAIVRGARREAQACGISVVFLLSLARHLGPGVNEPQARLLHRPVGHEFAGLDLAGDEAFAAEAFAAFFREWKAAGRGITIHAGEDPHGPGAENVRQAVAALGADRIGHGVLAHQDNQVLALLARRRTAVEVCLTSNVQTGAARGLRAHPLKRLLAAGIPATLNTDDPAISRTTLSRELFLAITRCGLSFSQLRTCAFNAAHAAFLPPAAKAALVRRIRNGWPARF